MPRVNTKPATATPMPGRSGSAAVRTDDPSHSPAPPAKNPMQALFDAIARMALPTDAQRIFHGRGGRFPGCQHLVLDAFPPVLLLTSFAALSAQDEAAIGAALAARWQPIAPGQPLNWVLQIRQGGERTDTRLMAGGRPPPPPAHARTAP